MVSANFVESALLYRCPAAVDREGVAVDHGGAGAREIDDAGGDFFGGGETVVEDAIEDVLAHFGVGFEHRLGEGVSTKVGQTVLTRMLSGAHSIASTRLRLTTPALLEQYAARS